MTALEYMKRQATKHQANLLRESARGVPGEMLDNIKAKVSYYTEAVEALSNQPQWVSVEERLPEERGSYLTSCKFSSYTELSILEWDGCYNGINEELHGRALWYDHDSEWGTYEVDCVTHWMPLPSVPKEEV